MNRPSSAAVVNPTRVPPLEASRSILMILGIVAHTILVLPFFQPALAGTDSQLAGSLYNFIHVFRLPTYFLISGHLAAWLLERSGFRGFLVSRWKRLTSVAIVAQVAIFITFQSVGCSICKVQGSVDWLHNGWLHLWFLYYLIIIAHLTLAGIWATQRWLPSVAESLKRWLGKVGPSVFWLLVLALVTGLIPGVMTNHGNLILDEGVIPNPGLLLTYAIYFWFGWLIYVNRGWEQIRRSWKRYLVALTVAALGFQVLSGFQVGGVMATAVASAMGWLGAILFLSAIFNLAKNHNAFWRYLDDSSYWVYLWHVVPVLILSWWLSRYHLALMFYLPLVVIGALGASVVTYQLGVRNTIVGLWLTGRRRPRRWTKEPTA